MTIVYPCVGKAVITDNAVRYNRSRYRPCCFSVSETAIGHWATARPVCTCQIIRTR
jgi:hypothetical protein